MCSQIVFAQDYDFLRPKFITVQGETLWVKKEININNPAFNDTIGINLTNPTRAKLRIAPDHSILTPTLVEIQADRRSTTFRMTQSKSAFYLRNVLIPNNDGTIAVNAIYPIDLDTNGNISLDSGFISGGGLGTVLSVGLLLPTNEFNISGSPVTTTGTLTGAWKNQTHNLVFASPDSGTGQPSFRALTLNDLPFKQFTAVLSGNSPFTDSLRITATGGIVGTQSGHNITLNFDSLDYAPWRYYGHNVGLRDTTAPLVIGSDHPLTGANWSSTRSLVMYNYTGNTPVLAFYHTASAFTQWANINGVMTQASGGAGVHKVWLKDATGIGVDINAVGFSGEFAAAGASSFGSFASSGLTGPNESIIVSGPVGAGSSYPRGGNTQLQVHTSQATAATAILNSGASDAGGASGLTLYPETILTQRQLNTVGTSPTTIVTEHLDTTYYQIHAITSAKKVNKLNTGSKGAVYEYVATMHRQGALATLDTLVTKHAWNTSGSNFNVVFSASGDGFIIQVNGGASTDSVTWQTNYWMYKGTNP